MKKLNEIQQRLKCNKSNVNQFGKYRYRKAEDILEAVKAIANDCTITLSDDIELVQCEEDKVVKVGKEERVIHVGGRYFLKATATISDGNQSASAVGWAELDSHAGMSKEQCVGAASSYARKYALCGLFSIDDSSSDPDAIDNRPRPTQGDPIAAINGCTTIEQLAQLWNANPAWQTDAGIGVAFTSRKNQILQKGGAQ